MLTSPAPTDSIARAWTALPLPIAILDTSVPPGAAVLAVALPALAHVLVGNLLEPHLFGSQFRMSPVIILLSLGVWWILWGIVGAMLAVPLTSILRIISSDLLDNEAGGPYVRLLHTLLEGRPLDVGEPADWERNAPPSAGGAAASKKGILRGASDEGGRWQKPAAVPHID